MPYSATVAIVGVGGIFPDAPDIGRFWDNIRHGRCAAREVPAGRWLVPPDNAFAVEIGREDRVYSRRGCFIDTIPPLSALTGLAMDMELLADLDPLFHLLLHAGKRAFDDGITAPLDRRRTGVIIGNLALPSEKASLLTRQVLGRTFEEQLLGRSLGSSTTDPLNRYVAGLPAGILAHALGLGGGSCTLDAACASSLYAVKLAMDELLAGRADAMLTGGVSRPDPLYTQMGFSQLRALSKRGICSPFDAAGDGLVVGEGAGLFLLKRTEDAVAHGDRIYGIIRGVGLANDVGGSLLAPMADGQLRAMRTAYDRAGWDPRDVDLIECHATGTPVGDATEVTSLRELWEGQRPEGDRCVIGSVKSNIGHLLTAAGAAALTKVLLAMREETLPPTAGFTSSQPGMALERSPFRVLTESVPWSRRTHHTPRRAAVSAFGFGGINAHLLVEEWLDPAGGAVSRHPEIGRKPAPPGVRPSLDRGNPPLIAVVGMDAHFGPWQSLRSFQERVLGGYPSVSPTRPERWWGADRSTWFYEEGLTEPPFNGFFLDEVTVNTDRFRIPPREMEEMLPQQLLMLKTAAGAMADAGLDREENLLTGVFIGIALDLNSTNFSFRWGIPGKAAEWAEQLGCTPTPYELEQWITKLRNAAGPPLSANRTMGALGSIVASRIAREFRIGGPSFTLSSEESSGLRALETAVRLLQQGEIDRALVGAVDLAGDLRAVLSHHARNPFSASGSCLPFDERADGSIVGEGAAAVVLKRVEDAERDGDRIYAVIRGIGTSGGTTLTPGADVYGLAIERAYTEAGIDPATITYLEAHATGQPTEDRREALALTRVFAKNNRPLRSCAVSGISPDIGHCGAASGIASFVRCCLALYNEIIPPCRGVERPLAELSGEGPLYLPRSPRYWLRNRDEGPRRAGVSVFGVDGTCVHVVLEGRDKEPGPEGPDRRAPLGRGAEALFAVTGETRTGLTENLDRLRTLCSGDPCKEPAMLAREWYRLAGAGAEKALALTMVARSRTELDALLEQAGLTLAAGEGTILPPPPALRDRLFYTTAPLGRKGNIAFVFPGSGNHYPDMGAELSVRWPEIFRRQDRENLKLRSQFLPELFWNGASATEIDNNHRAVIFGQVATGCTVSDIVRSFGVEPRAVIGYSLGESAGLFALHAWKDRDQMLARMQESTLFTRDLAGECRAAASTWGLPEGSRVEWNLGVVEATASEVRQALRTTPRVYLLIVNTPDECVIGGDAKGVRRLVDMLGRRFFPLHGVTTVHCEVAKAVASQYHDLHLFPTCPPRAVTFYSGARGNAYDVTRESAANAILAQAVEGIDYPATIEAAYAAGVRIFLEMGPGSSCSRMIGRILADRPHMARSACYPGQDQVSTLLRMLAHLVAERVPIDLEELFAGSCLPPDISAKRQQVRVNPGGASFAPPLPAFSPVQRPVSASTAAGAGTTVFDLPAAVPGKVPAMDGLVRDFAAAQDAQIKAHEVFLRFSDGIIQTMADAVAHELALVEALRGDGATMPAVPPPAFDRDLCIEFARGSVGTMLGPEFAEVDRYPTRVRLPDEPLMLVDRIITLEGEPRSMSHGRVVTEHDIHPGAWYLDGGHIPTCIAVEAGQADLFLSGYLGIDFKTRGMAVYRLLDAVVTFHRGLPGPGQTIHYDIRIERFFRQGDTWLFRFFFEASVDGEPLLSMRDGCAGFFNSAELEAGKGIVRPAIDLRPISGNRPNDWQELVTMASESYDAKMLARLRAGDLAGCFGPLFAGLDLVRPLTIPGGRMELVHRVVELLPRSGRYGEGFIRAEADIHPDDWFITCHFVDDRVMPGTLMYECCMHTLRIFLLRMGWVAEEGSAAWEPVPGVASGLRCRGQVLASTKVVTYEVNIRELGYRPEPYVICDALMYADGKPIVEITSMSARLAGTTKEQLENLWQGKPAVTLPLTPSHQGRGDLNSPSLAGRTDLYAPSPLVGEGRGEGVKKPPLYTKEQILAYSNGNPSEGFGEAYRIFDAGAGRKIARLPGPPFQFMDRVTAIKGEPWRMAAGSMAEAQYDIPPDAWYFAADRQSRMPFSVLLEAALQPCGWLAAYVGSALTSPTDISFRNLGGIAVQHRPVTPESGTLTCSATMKKVATSGGMIIQEFDFTVADRQGILYEGETMFGFFSREALANQVGIRDATPYVPTAAETGRSRRLPYPAGEPFPEKQLRMIDLIDRYIPDGGPTGLGYLRGVKDVDPDEWFFKAHFYEDPVVPGSLGLESFLQLMKFAAVERWGWQERDILETTALEHRHRWLYRGQVVPANSRVTVEGWITAVDDSKRTMTANGFLSVDGKSIYQMNDFTVRLVRG